MLAILILDYILGISFIVFAIILLRKTEIKDIKIKNFTIKKGFIKGILYTIYFLALLFALFTIYILF